MIITHKGRTVEIHQEQEIPAAVEQLKRQEPGSAVAQERQTVRVKARRPKEQVKAHAA